MRLAPLKQLYKSTCLFIFIIVMGQVDAGTVSNTDSLFILSDYPAWFLDTDYNLQQELEIAQSSGKQGLMIVFSLPNCSYCQHFSQETLRNTEISRKLKDNFYAIHIDLSKDDKLVAPDGREMTIKQFGKFEKAFGTPAVYFYNANGKRLVHTMGFQPIERFEHVLDFVTEQHYLTSTLSSYLVAANKRDQGILERQEDDIELVPIPYVPDPCPACGEAADDI